MNHDRPLLQSAPMEIHWAGWRSDTVTLQRNGWKFAQEVDHSRYNEIRLVLTHEQAQVIGRIDSHELRHSVYDMPPLIRNTCLNLRHMSRDMIFHVEKMPLYAEMDMEPSWTNERVLPNEIFRTLVPENAEVLIDKADMNVVEHLEAIKALQAPKQFDLRQQARKETSRSTRQVVAQLVDYA